MSNYWLVKTAPTGRAKTGAVSRTLKSSGTFVSRAIRKRRPSYHWLYVVVDGSQYTRYEVHTCIQHLLCFAKSPEETCTIAGDWWRWLQAPAIEVRVPIVRRENHGCQ